ncbi:hypothetical protein [Hyalangium gracile]|uniref:hypothetical protein n=1 Tax=Hyalangium gracile TaxID=394092 RepID=UPI001CCE36D4|nr:hypothetical protein [Hyalangium gracile]
METTVQHEAERARRLWPAPERVSRREQGKRWPVVGVTLGLNVAALGLSWLARGIRKPSARMLRVGGPLLALSSWAYALFIRSWHLRWGATSAEVQQSMPGDELVPHPHLDTTRAITVEARPEAIWPWLVQMGYHRGGWYSYDWLDNLGAPSARNILPELQNLQVGDRLTPIASGFVVAAVEPQRSLVLLTRDPRGRIRTSWTFLIEPIGPGRCRLIERLRCVYDFNLLGLLLFLAIEPADFVMMRKQMLNLKRRAEVTLTGARA